MSPKKILYPKTQWHKLLAGVLEEWLTPVGINVQTEIPISSNPPKADILLLKSPDKKFSHQQYLRLSDGLRSGSANQLLLEFKYTESLNEEAVLQLLGYRTFYLGSQKLKPKNLDCFLLCSHTPKQDTLDYLGFVESKHSGVFQSQSALVSHITLLSLNDLSDEPQNIPLKCFASKRKENQKAYASIQANKLQGMSLKLECFLNGLWKLLFREGKNMSTVTNIEELTPDYVEEVGREWIDHWLKTLPAEKLMKDLKPEERLKGLEPEERLKGLKPEEIMKVVGIGDRLSGLSDDELKILKEKLKDI